MLPRSELNHSDSISNKAFSLIRVPAGVSSLPSFYLKAGMALEGCLVLPVFIFFMITLLYSLEIQRFQSDVYEAVHIAGSRECFYGYRDEYGASKGMVEPEGNGTEYGIRQYLESQMLPFFCVEEGVRGLDIQTYTDNLENVEIHVKYRIKPFIRWLPIGNLSVSDSFYGHKFVGYTGNGAEEKKGKEETYVYITDTGTKYHISRECTYLKVQIQALKGENIKELRNSSGGKYYPCERCNPKETGMVYLTEWGNRYHGESDCSALKRTVYLVPLSETGGRTACSKCS